MFHVFFVHQTHQFEVCRILYGRLVILHAAIQSEKLTLASLAQIISRGYYFFEDFSIPNCSEALLQKSTSTSKRPIFSYNSFSRLATSSSGALVENISAPRARNSRFQLEIICGCTSNRLASSLSVSASLIASIATWALKAALCFFLLVDIMSKFNRFLLNLPCGLNYWEYYKEWYKTICFPKEIYKRKFFVL